MGYELNIKRENNNISKKEWLDYINSDIEFEKINQFSVTLEDNEELTISTPNAGLWKTEKGEVPFTYFEKYGEISVKNPEHWIIEKMISIAEKLNAIVEGEEGEIYDEKYLKDAYLKPSENIENEKKWWKFWK